MVDEFQSPTLGIPGARRSFFRWLANDFSFRFARFGRQAPWRVSL